jgi:hypothetical protein
MRAAAPTRWKSKAATRSTQQLGRVPAMNEKERLHHYLRVRRDNLLGKLDGLSEYDVRRPMTPTGTNLLGLVKHVASVEVDYFGVVFDDGAANLGLASGDHCDKGAGAGVPGYPAHSLIFQASILAWIRSNSASWAK